MQQQLGGAERILYTERHHWVFFVAEMIKWILFAAAVLALVVVLRAWLLPGAGWVWWLLLVFLVPAARIAWGFLSSRMNVRAHRPAGDRVDRRAQQARRRLLAREAHRLRAQAVGPGPPPAPGDVVVPTAAANAGINDLKQIRRPAEFKTQMLDAKGQPERELGASD